MDHRHGLAVCGQLTAAGASAERDAAVGLAAGAIPPARATLAADKTFDPAASSRQSAPSGSSPQRRAQLEEPSQCDRRADNRARQLWAQPTSTQTRRGDLRLTQCVAMLRQTRHRDAPGSAGCRLDPGLWAGSVQLDSDSESHSGGRSPAIPTVATTSSRPSLPTRWAYHAPPLLGSRRSDSFAAVFP